MSDEAWDRVELSLYPYTREDVTFDVEVTVKPLWKRLPNSIAERIEREKAEARFRMLAHELARDIWYRLEQKR